MKKFLSILSIALTLTTPSRVFSQQLRVIPQTSEFARQILTNETAAAWAAQILLGTNFNFGNFALLNGTNNFSGANSFTNTGNVFVGDGSGLKNVPTTNLVVNLFGDVTGTQNQTVVSSVGNAQLPAAHLTGTVSPGIVGTGLGAMAFQPTNAPVFNNGTNYGPLVIATNSNYPAASDGSALVIPNYDFVRFGTVGTIRSNPSHGTEAEMEYQSQGRMAFVVGYDQQGIGAIQIGTPGPTHEEVYIDGDVNPGGTDVTPGGISQNFGPSKIFHLYSGWLDTNGVAHNALTGMRSETIDRQGTTEQRFYNPATTGNPKGVGSVNGAEQLAIGSNYVRIDGGQLFGIKTTAATPTATYPINWTNTIDSVSPSSSPLAVYSTNFFASGAKKDVVFWGAPYVNVSLTWPANWVQLTPLPATLTNATVGKLTLLSLGTNDSQVLASWSVANYTPIVDASAASFITASGIANLTQQNAIISLVGNLKSFGLFSKLTAFYPLVGGTAASDKWNLINTNLYALTYSGNLYYTNGLRGDGTNGAASTGLSTSTFATSSECMIFVNIQDTAPPLANANFWSSDVNCQVYMNGTTFGFFLGPLGSANAVTVGSSLGGTNYSGFFGVNVHANSEQCYVNGSVAGGVITSAGSTSATTINLFGSTSQNLQYTAAAFGANFSGADMANLINCVQQFESALGR